MTFPKHLEDCPAQKLGEYPGNSTALNYNEGIFVGYRYYDTYKVEPQFAFGHGLSYTTFAYNNVDVKTADGKVTAKVSIKNTGKIAGAEVVQLYVKEDKPTVERPEKELKAFSKVFLKPGEEKIVTLQLNEDAFRYFDEGKMKWVHNPGKYTLLIGSSSRDIRKTTEVNL
jgi:beta-glucosidase